ncbi:hypothetical protein TNCV_4713751 [Trichonephila clavipes]|nr:hypothetical protein TNCV_4713751 [Trichonephila clavipes]
MPEFWDHIEAAFLKPWAAPSLGGDNSMREARVASGLSPTTRQRRPRVHDHDYLAIMAEANFEIVGCYGMEVAV